MDVNNLNTKININLTTASLVAALLQCITACHHPKIEAAGDIAEQDIRDGDAYIKVEGTQSLQLTPDGSHSRFTVITQ